MRREGHSVIVQFNLTTAPEGSPDWLKSIGMLIGLETNT